MARFGRAQPHPPIFLRAPLIAAVVAGATVSPIHVISLTAERSTAPPARHASVLYVRPNRASVVPDKRAPQVTLVLAGRERGTLPKGVVLFLRPSRTSLVPDRVAPQIHIIQASARPRHLARDADVVVLRNPAVPVAADPGKATPQIHVVSLGLQRSAIRPDGGMLYLRPSRSAFVPDRLGSPIHVLGVPRDRRRPGGSQIVFLRQYSVLQTDPGKATPQIHVVSLTPLRSAIRPDSAVLYLRPSRSAHVPDRITQQVHVLLQPRERALPPTQVVFVRNALVPPAPFATLAPQIHVVSLTVPRAAMRPDGAVLYLRPSRTALVPAKLAPQIHVIGQVGSRLRVVRKPMLLFRHGGPPAVVVIPLPLQLEDRSGFRYGVLDQSGKRYLVIDQSGLRLVSEDYST